MGPDLGTNFERAVFDDPWRGAGRFAVFRQRFPLGEGGGGAVEEDNGIGGRLPRLGLRARGAGLDAFRLGAILVVHAPRVGVSGRHAVEGLAGVPGAGGGRREEGGGAGGEEGIGEFHGERGESFSGRRRGATFSHSHDRVEAGACRSRGCWRRGGFWPGPRCGATMSASAKQGAVAGDEHPGGVSRINYIRFFASHPPWYVHLYVADTYSAVFKQQYHQYCLKPGQYQIRKQEIQQQLDSSNSNNHNPIQQLPQNIGFLFHFLVKRMSI